MLLTLESKAAKDADCLIESRGSGPDFVVGRPPVEVAGSKQTLNEV